jgi:GNAT superfamily N-acetyltransferase
MSLQWIHETAPVWDETKRRLLESAPWVFDPANYEEGNLLPGDWWRVEDGGKVVGYGWMDCTWGEAEVLLAVGSETRRRGIGTYILDRLEEEARRRGVNYIYNVVPSEHPEPDRLAAWLRGRRFADAERNRLIRATGPRKEA